MKIKTCFVPYLKNHWDAFVQSNLQKVHLSQERNHKISPEKKETIFK